MGIAKNDIIRIEITDISGQGSGIGRYDGMAIFIPQTVVGDIINARILKVKKSYAFAKVENIVTPSKFRIPVDCECFQKCGGCVFRHISYEQELKIKQKRVNDALRRIGRIDNYTMNSIVGCENPNNYRNKSQIPIGEDNDGHIIMGFYGNHSHRIINCSECRLHPAVFDQIGEIVRQWVVDYNIPVYNELTHRGMLRHLYIRNAEKSTEIMVCLVINGSKLPYSDELVERLKGSIDSVKSVVVNSNCDKTNVILGKRCTTIYGRDYITDELCGLKFNISPLSFYQVNRDQAERLYGLVKDYACLTGSEFVIDLYCGTGTIGLSLAHKAKKVLGIEIIPQAIQNAKENAKINKIENAEFICSDASAAADKLAAENTTPDVVIVDPPRKGCDPVVIESIHRMSPEKVVYVSCDPETLARDLNLFTQSGYVVEEVTSVDMFPRTEHVESVVLLTKVHN